MTARPVPMDKAQLLALLDSIRARVEADDSFEGYLEYGMPIGDDGELLEGVDFLVLAGYRVGNRQGQGGFRHIALRRDDDG